MPKNELIFLYINSTKITNSNIRILHSKYTCLERKARNILPMDEIIDPSSVLIFLFLLQTIIKLTLTLPNL